MRQTSVQRKAPGLDLYLVGIPVGDLFFVAMASTLLSVVLNVPIITKMASVRVRRVTVLLLFRFPDTGFSTAFLLLAIPLFETVFVGVRSLVAGVSEIRTITGVYWEVIGFSFTTLFSSILVVPPRQSGKLWMGWLLRPGRVPA